MSLIVAHPDTQHSAHAARGLKRAGMLRFLFTSVSLRRPAWFGQCMKVAAPAVHARLAQHRAHRDFAPEEVRVFPVHVLAQRLGPRAWAMSQRWFGRRAGQLGIDEGCGVMAFNTNAVDTFRMLRREGLPCILDQTIAHRRWSVRVGQAECEEYPEWGDTWTAPAWQIEREDEELQLADIVLCGSEFCAGTMVEEGIPREKLAVVEYGADTTRFHPCTSPRKDGREVRLLFVGAMAMRKGFHYLLAAAKNLRALGVKVTLAGATRASGHAWRAYSDVLEPPRFRLHDEMPALYRAHDIYVFPSLVEGSSLSVYEALASGLPVITTPNAGTIVRDGVEGLIVPPRDTEALTMAVERLVRDRDLRVHMGRAARMRAESYGDWIHYGERLAQVLRTWDRGA